MTNRELLQKAMPLVSLSNSQWELINEHLSKQKGELFTALETLLVNQSRIETISNHNDYYFDKLDDTLSECSSCLSYL